MSILALGRKHKEKENSQSKKGRRHKKKRKFPIQEREKTQNKFQKKKQQKSLFFSSKNPMYNLTKTIRITTTLKQNLPPKVFPFFAFFPQQKHRENTTTTRETVWARQRNLKIQKQITSFKFVSFFSNFD